MFDNIQYSSLGEEYTFLMNSIRRYNEVNTIISENRKDLYLERNGSNKDIAAINEINSFTLREAIVASLETELRYQFEVLIPDIEYPMDIEDMKSLGALNNAQDGDTSGRVLAMRNFLLPRHTLFEHYNQYINSVVDSFCAGKNMDLSHIEVVTGNGKLYYIDANTNIITQKDFPEEVNLNKPWYSLGAIYSLNLFDSKLKDCELLDSIMMDVRGSFDFDVLKRWINNIFIFGLFLRSVYAFNNTLLSNLRSTFGEDN